MTYKLQPPFKIYIEGTQIADAAGHICSAENPEIAKAILAALQETAQVRFGFASFKGGTFELIAINIKTGEEVILEGRLRPDQTIDQIDRVFPTCVYVNAVAK